MNLKLSYEEVVANVRMDWSGSEGSINNAIKAVQKNHTPKKEVVPMSHNKDVKRTLKNERLEYPIKMMHAYK